MLLSGVLPCPASLTAVHAITMRKQQTKGITQIPRISLFVREICILKFSKSQFTYLLAFTRKFVMKLSLKLDQTQKQDKMPKKT